MSDQSDRRILVLDADASDIVAALEARRQGRYVVVADAARLDTDDAEVCLGSPDLVMAAADRLPQLRWIQSTWAGVQPLLPLLERRPQLQLTGVKGIFGPLMAEYVFGWVAALERRLFDYRQQQEEGLWRQLPERPSAGRRMVVLGLGSIGSHIAAVARAFGLTVAGVSRTGKPVAGVEKVYPVAELEQAVAGADYLISVVPDIPATRELIDAQVLAALAPGAILINVGRGSVVVDDDVLAALGSGQLGAAVLDVFREEPLPAKHPFWTTPGLYITPHTAAVTPPVALAELFLANLARYEAGQPLEHAVDRERGY